MSYENAPATKILATHCACCSRPLVDAVSVETGVGPDCRAKHGYDEAQGPADWDAVFFAIEAGEDYLGYSGLGASWQSAVEAHDAHKAANVLVHLVAVEQDGRRVNRYTNAIHALGYEKLSARLVKRLAKIHIGTEGTDFVVRTPYSAEAVEAFRGIPGRRWDSKAKANRVPAKSKTALWDVLLKVYKGHTAIGPKGLFVIGQ